MTIFRDPEYERLKKEEWLTLATEDHYFSLYERLSSIGPQEISPDVVLDAMDMNGYCDTVTLRKKMLTLGIISKYDITPMERKLLLNSEMFHYVVSVPEFNINKDLPKIMCHPNIERLKEHIYETAANLSYYMLTSKSYDLQRVNTIIESFANKPKEVKNIKRSKNGYKKMEWLTMALYLIINENRWNIKSIDLILKLVEWIKDYLEHGSIHALSMITKLKAMTHLGKPIYSVEGQ